MVNPLPRHTRWLSYEEVECWLYQRGESDGLMLAQIVDAMGGGYEDLVEMAEHDGHADGFTEGRMDMREEALLTLDPLMEEVKKETYSEELRTLVRTVEYNIKHG